MGPRVGGFSLVVVLRSAGFFDKSLASGRSVGRNMMFMLMVSSYSP